MSDRPARVPTTSPAWTIVAHVGGATAIGVLESARLGAGSLALVLIPLFAATGLAAGAISSVAERAAARRAWWLAALIVAAPSLLVAAPVAATLFEGAYAQTLPLASLLPVVVPLVVWVGVAAAIAGGRRLLRDGDLISRAIAILGGAGASGAIIWAERHVLGSGYPAAHAGGTLAVIVLAGVIVRVAARPRVSPYVAATVAAIALGTAAAATVDGLRATADRRLLAVRGEQGNHLVRVWRLPFDRDGDGSSRVLGGGDCDDHDATRHPGAADSPGDGIDQDCDGADAVPPPEVAAPEAVDLAAWRAQPAVRQVLERTRGMNVLVLTVDALRFDVLAPDTSDRAEFPHLTKLLDESVWFVRAIAPGAGTDISIGTLLTGRLDPFQPIATTLPEALRALGRRTFSAIPVEVSRYVGDTILTRGVDRPKAVHTDWGKADVGDHVSGPTTTAEGLRALDQAKDTTWAIWLHYFDVHEHHQIDVPRELLAAVSATGSSKRHRYRGLLAAIDQEIGKVRAELATRGLADRTLIVFASDHGESLGEDPRLGDTHGKVTYAPLVRIPFAIHIPGVPGGVRTDAASLVDVAPTVLALLGDPSKMAPLDGLDLVPALLDAPAALRPASRALLIHEQDQWSVVEWPHQLIVRPADNLVELYDLERDPAQRADLSTQLPDVVTRLRARYAAGPQLQIDRTAAGRRSREQRALPPQPPARP